MNPRSMQNAMGLGALGAGLGAAFGGTSSPYSAASPYMNQVSSTITPYYQPYINAGTSALNTLQGQYSNLLGNYGGIQNQYSTLMTDPQAIMNMLGANYTQSPGYEWQYNQAMNAANNAAATGGMAGTPQHQQQSATLATNLANQDYYNYLNYMMNLYKTGLSGSTGLYGMGLQGEQGLNQMGYAASNELANSLARSLQNQAQMAFAGQAAENASTGSMWGDIAAGVGMFL